jgi:hypothetical protein
MEDTVRGHATLFGNVKGQPRVCTSEATCFEKVVPFSDSPI